MSLSHFVLRVACFVLRVDPRSVDPPVDPLVDPRVDPRGATPFVLGLQRVFRRSTRRSTVYSRGFSVDPPVDPRFGPEGFEMSIQGGLPNLVANLEPRPGEGLGGRGGSWQGRQVMYPS